MRRNVYGAVVSLLLLLCYESRHLKTVWKQIFLLKFWGVYSGKLKTEQIQSIRTDFSPSTMCLAKVFFTVMDMLVPVNVCI